MRKGTSSDHFFQTDAEQALKERRAAKAGNKNGNPITLKSKLLAAIPDPASPPSIFIAESTGSVRRVDVDTEDTKDLYRGPSAPVTCVALGGPGLQTIFAGSWDKDIWSWNVRSKTQSRRYRGHSDFVKAVVCTKVGGKDCLVSGGADKKIMVWDIETGSRVHTIQDPITPMMAIQDLVIDVSRLSEDSVVLFSASSDPHIRQWSLNLTSFVQINMPSPKEPGKVQDTILEHETTVYKLVFDDDGDEIDLWTASADGTAKCLSRAKDFTTAETIQHGDHVRAVAVTTDWVVTAGRDEDVKVWNRLSGKLYCTLEGHYDEVTDLVILDDGRRVVSVSIDGTVRVWPLTTAELDKANQEREDRANGVEKESPIEKPPDLMTAEEEAELAALMEDD